MHHRAFCLLPPTATTLSFNALLQAAAGRAWQRTVVTASRPPIIRKRQNSAGTAQLPKWDAHGAIQPSPITHSPEKRSLSSLLATQGGVEPSRISRRVLDEKRSQTDISTPSLPLLPGYLRANPSYRPHVTYFQPENIQDSDLQYTDPGRSINSGYPNTPLQHGSALSQHRDDNLTSAVGTKVLQKSSYLSIPPAISTTSLFRNLLYVLSHRDPLPDLPALLDYHDLYPGLRSTRSYNLLISFALRHSSFGSVRWLLSSMHADGVSGNLETWKLTVRWLIQAGWWDRVWKEAIASMNLQLNGTRMENPGINQIIPLPIRLELFRTLKRGSIRRRVKPHRASAVGENLLQPPMGIYKGTRPILTAEELTRAHPRTVYFIVMTMLKSQRGETALSLTSTYLRSLPAAIPARWARTCLDIIHLHIIFGSSTVGLEKFYQVRRTFVSLIRLHRALYPTSTTLFLLLSPLRRAKRCGTVAWNCLRKFKAQWGETIEDRRVRRRVMTFAGKEGRMDIVEAVWDSEKTSRWAHRGWKEARQLSGSTVLVPSRKLLRPPTRTLFRYNGREERLWHLLKRRTKRILIKKRTK